ncbi:acyltransferase [Agrilactobacillus yilanensis]|uniref:Acyltransferase n=1 Tax=Agrilactobacillus yilanensis TaxID=2485997 RepID=A0ABW4J309_9LACO|nr:acyltransferase [Agrilactobacillus yilanensis]
MIETKKRRYLHEVDLMRVIFIGGVLLNHTTTAFRASMASGTGSKLFLEATHLALHFTRMGFMFMTGLVLVLNYYNKEHHWLQFWRKRYINVGIPYVAWNAIILFIASLAMGALNWPTYWANLGSNLKYANQYYMYYIMVTFELYLIFPLIIYLFKKLSKHHLAILLTSLGLQFLIVFGIKYGLPHVDRSSWWYLFRAYGTNVLTYQFYFVAGAYVAIHYDQVNAFIEKFHRVIIGITGILALGTVGLFFFNLNVLNLSFSATESVHQPFILLYDVFMIATVFWVGRQYAKARENGFAPWLDRGIKNISKVSFGIYLVQSLPLFLLYGILDLVTLPAWVLLLLFPLGYVFVLGGAYLISWFCYKIPPFGVLIGRPQWHLSKGVTQHVKNNFKTQTTIERQPAKQFNQR